jgi:predicted HicB family RNase H-like nuclease
MDIPKSKMVSMKIDERILIRAKNKAEAEKRSFTKFVENLLEMYLNGELIEKPRK